MERMSVVRLAELAGATLVWGTAGPAPVQVGPDVVIDSREATEGALFVALPGDKVDGHDFAAAAVRNGAAAVLAQHVTDAAAPHLLVPAGIEGLSRLAQGLITQHKARGLKVVAVTGSSGKTSTKDLIAQVLETAGPTVSPQGSFNNEIGVPLTATRVNNETAFLVSEMGARGIGQVAWLCGIAQPDVGVVLNVGRAHLGEFGSVADTARAKGELVEAATAWAILNADDDNVAAMASRARGRTAFFSAQAAPVTGDLRVWATQLKAGHQQCYGFILHVAGVGQDGQAAVQLRVPGRHNVDNALAAAAVGLVQGLTVSAVAAALSAAQARSRWRMEIVRRPDGVTIVNDSYNANPDSMRAALRTLHGLRHQGGRLIAVLGDMLELGQDSAHAHREIGHLVAELGIDELYAVGEFATDLVAGAAPVAGQVYPDRKTLTDALVVDLVPPDVVLVKASRGLALDTVVQDLLSSREANGEQL